MALTNVQVSEVIKNFQKKEGDTGSPEVQVALLSARIEALSEHFKNHEQDKHSRHGLLRLINHRRSLLQYLRQTNNSRYRELIERLGLRK